eukprot:4143805-Prorocentrum_lima.AAC.1
MIRRVLEHLQSGIRVAPHSIDLREEISSHTWDPDAELKHQLAITNTHYDCLLYTSDAADDM